MSIRGMGRVFRRGKIWWIAYSKGGKEHRESSRSTKRSEAVTLLKKRNEQKFVSPRVMLSEILHDRLSDAKLRNMCEQSIRNLKNYHRRFISFFGDIPARNIATSDIRRYQALRLGEGASGGTVNREVSGLGKALRLAVQSDLLNQCPIFPPRLHESEPRQGFFEHEDYLAIRKHLVPWAQDVLDFAYYSGWRRGEILGLRWAEVFEDSIRLDPKRSKTRRGRILPLDAGIRPIIERRARQRVFSCPYVFQRDGKRVIAETWQVHWKNAREKASRQHIILHDARRTMARNMMLAGASQRVVMERGGWVTRKMFDRYHIIKEEELAEAGDRLKTYLNGKELAGKIVPLFPRKERKRP